ncbi:MAG TPA: ABC transporter substrate-binding protein [Acidimicrobiia bacterium]|nr:ABC transporter substrate-binding protein [Acidimicrobiia bacterium]
MQDKTLRTIGASVVLIGVAIAAVAQVAAQEAEPAEIVAVEPTTAPSGKADTTHPDSEPTTTQPEPFVYRVGVLSGVTTDNFWAFYGEQPSTWNSYILGPTKPALFTFDASVGSLRPELAAAEIKPVFNKEGWRVRVELNRGLEWSDGTPITAHDMVFTFETVRALELGGSWVEAFPATIVSMHADADHSLRIEFTERPQLSVWPHGVGLAPIMARHVWEDIVADGDTAGLYAHPGHEDVGGGPLALVAVSESLAISNANPGYPFGSTPDVVEYHVYADEAAAVAALGGGEIDSVLTPKGLTLEHLETIESDPGVEVVENPGNGIRYLGFNLNRDPMSEQAFRTALALLVEREHLAESIPQAGEAAWALIPEANSRWFDPEVASETESRYTGELSARLQTALEGLVAAGYGWSSPPSIGEAGELVAGEGLTIDGRAPQPLTILTPGDTYDPARPDYVQEIADTLAILGFDARPVETDFDTVVDLAFTPGEDGALHYDMYLLGWTLGNPALPGYYRALFASGGAMNNTGYSSESFAKALESYEDAFTTDAAHEALWEMERALSVDLPYLLLYTNQITEVYRSDRVSFDIGESLGGLQARFGGIWDVRPTD